MKTLIACALLLALASPAHAETCTGRVKNDVTTNELHPKGTRLLTVGDCIFTKSGHEKRVLRTCPMGSRCRVEIDGQYGPDGEIENILSVTRVQPYRDGMRDYREGLCFRAYSSDSEEQALWKRGYYAHQTEKIGKRNDERCFPGRLH